MLRAPSGGRGERRSFSSSGKPVMADDVCFGSGSSALPEFGDTVAHRTFAVTPCELFCRLFVDQEEHVHYFEPAYVFAAQAARVPLPVFEQNGSAYLDALLGWARAELGDMERPVGGAELVSRVAREFAPCGLSDGSWLRGWMLANTVETEVGMLLLQQLMQRFGDPGSQQSYAERYAALLESLGVPPGSITRESEGGAAACSATSYEHALLGLTLGLFPTALGPETLGFNWWMATFGPCPLLDRLAPELRARGAASDYLDRHDRVGMAKLAAQSVRLGLGVAPEPELIRRVAGGFVAAHRSYQRWERAVLGESVPLAGLYAPPQDPESLAAFAFERYGELSCTDLYFHFANADRHPAIVLFGRVFVDQVFAGLSAAFEGDARLNSMHPPEYSERSVAEMVAAQHEKNVRSREAFVAPPPATVDTADAVDAAKLAEDAEDDGLDTPSIIQVFDGSWLQGFADVQRAGYEEYGWLFRIYASEHGDGDFAYNHCQIFRKAFTQLGPHAMLPKTDRRLYDLFEIGAAAVTTLAVSLNTRRFLPEILGINLGIEATGVGGSYMDQWKNARGPGAGWRALAWRLHNSIDNYADGHTKWSLSAVQAFMRRVKDAAPGDVEAHWRRIWQMWRCQDILTHGSEGEREALAEYIGAGSLAPTPG
jgi:hypothetical protein